MRFLVFGSSGMAGHLISRYLVERGHYVEGFCRHPAADYREISGDVRDTDLVEKVVCEGNYDVIINAIGILNRDAERDKSQAVFANAFFPHYLASLVQSTECRIFHMSTDCVYRGNTGPYDEMSFPDGTSFYDRSKALGELCDDHNLTFRNSIVGPDINPAGIGLMNWFMQQEGEVKGYSNAIWTGLTTLELAKAMEYAALYGGSGLVNMVPECAISKYDLLVLFNRYLCSDSLTVTPYSDFKLDKTLMRRNFAIDYRPSSYEEQIREIAEWIRSHCNLYPHYKSFGRGTNE
ncbi:sugar nucleotide-binding protein [Adlercreutzia sp. R25]|uniref:SDR family oxidoreductase n=1 Tax=Adlercreutzia shanghongiae TaxID=3111773 RepID=UPI002DB77A7A|nr:sugar nucleotide-binding protein [Adlercreutzia sp. R25]MEC4273870.1 sugar nucleotide-binding protein [Adlercreutzia sp. R25]